MRQVGTATDVHMQTADRQAVMVGAAQAVVELLVPDAVLALLPAGVRLLTVAVAKAGVDPQRDVCTRRTLPKLIDHFGRAAVNRNSKLHHGIQRLAVKDISRVNNLR